MSAVIILIKLIAAHLVGDFILQSDKMCADKFSKNKTVRYRALSEHAIIQATLAYLLVAQWTNWVVPLVIGVSHFLIDLIKTHFKRKILSAFYAISWSIIVSSLFYGLQHSLIMTSILLRKSSLQIFGLLQRRISRYSRPHQF